MGRGLGREVEPRRGGRGKEGEGGRKKGRMEEEKGEEEEAAGGGACPARLGLPPVAAVCRGLPPSCRRSPEQGAG
jgi:hypothetical protein